MDFHTFVTGLGRLVEENPFLEDFVHTDLICAETSVHFGAPNFQKRKYSDHSVALKIYKASPPDFDLFHYCGWRNEQVDCFTIFEEVLTSEGVCYTFNTLAAGEIFRNESIQHNYSYLKSSKPRKGWSPENGYSSNDEKSYPWRGRSSSGVPDLQVIFEEDPEKQDPFCNGLRVGYKVFLQHPSDLPQSSLYYYSALPGQITSFALKFNIMNTSDNLARYPPQIRQCYFPSEVQLKYFQVYTPNNCRLECLSNYTYKRCGCFWFHMPHNDSSVICTTGSKECVTNAHEDYAAEESLGNMTDSLCQCLPLCTSIQYDADVLKTSYEVTKFKKFERRISNEVFNNNRPYNTRDIDNELTTRIEIYFKEPRFPSMRRSEQFGLTEFLANCGGLLGLFLGFSILSLVEIFYFLTLRLCCVIRKQSLETKINASE